MKKTLRRNFLLSSLCVAALPSLSVATEKKTTKDMPLRRKNAEISEEECWKVINDVPHAVLATADSAGIPYGVPITPWVYKGKIYFHGAGANTGRRAENLKQNPYATLTYIARDKTNEHKLDVDYVSVIVSGPVKLLEDKQEKINMMRALMKRHTPSVDIEKELSKRELKIAAVTNVYELTPEKITGKAKGPAYKDYFGKERQAPANK